MATCLEFRRVLFLSLVKLEPAMVIVPVCTATAPLLLNAGPMAVLPVPPLFRKVPVLLIVARPPRLFWKLVSPATSNVPVLLNVAPCPLHKSPPLNLVVPALLIVRCPSCLLFDLQRTRR